MPASIHAPATGSPTRADGRASYQRARRRASVQALMLALPLIVFLLSTFIAPIALLLARSVENKEVPGSMPTLTRALNAWDGRGVPDEHTFALLAAGLRDAQQSGQLGTVARRLNFAQPEFRSLLMRTARSVRDETPPAWKPALIEMDERWNSPEIWRLLKRAATSPTPDYLLAAVDAQVTPQGNVAFVPDNSSVYRQAFLRTISISASVTLLCLVLGYPVAWLLANLPAQSSNRLMLFVIVPFWTSLLVRTTAWYVLLQPGGVINGLLMGLGLATHPVPLIFNRTGVLIGMTHVLLPYMILAIYSVMKGVSPVYVRAAQSLGAHPFTAFVRVYIPQTLPGVGAGCFLVFVLALGYYITPALLGGAGDEMISQLIALQTNTQLNWGLAGALSAYLVIFTAIFYFLFNRIVGIDRLRFG
ncbi:binding-protein-dependent transport system inner membrane protein [Caballeronia turbans]|jgi:putative spermidine/putrescine transport system permease protein|uniref:ABC transporter permease n=1 Tax=unclassified Caballeronia TaxID=2646786 RepID=UPI00074C2AC0|nr:MULTISPECIES: ABC transporter permease [unclassified Caballeronia]SAL40404.1 binding-protein-dependent transport system inner membrane protein [Caballeronia turbans]